MNVEGSIFSPIPDDAYPRLEQQIGLTAENVRLLYHPFTQEYEVHINHTGASEFWLKVAITPAHLENIKQQALEELDDLW